MALEPKKLDPVQSLVDYTNDVKPYHTKLVEVLVEYIHTDYIRAYINDEMHMCLNFGYPDLNTLFAYNINSVDVNNNYFYVVGDASNLIHTGQRILVAYSDANNGIYYVKDIAYDIRTNKTLIAVINNIPFNNSTGQIVNSLINYCGYPDSMTSTNPHDLGDVSCRGGYGTFYDSLLNDVIYIDELNKQIWIDSDVTYQFNNVKSVSLLSNNIHVLEYITNIPSLDSFKVYADLTNDVNIGDTITISSPTFIEYGQSEIQNFKVSTINYDGSYSHITFLGAFPILNMENAFIEISDVVGVLRLKTVSDVDEFNEQIDVNTVYFDGTNTVIEFVDDITNFPKYDSNNSHTLLVKYLGYDIDYMCGSSGINGERLFVRFKELLDFNIVMDWTDKVHTYNWENTARNGYDTVNFGMIDSITEPPMPESATAPSNPNLFDIWYNTDTNKMMQWRNYAWVPVTAIYWYQEDALNNQTVTYHKRIKNSILDTGWLEFEPTLNDLVSSSYNGVYDSEPYTIYHDTQNIYTNVNDNYVVLYGGDYRHMIINNVITGYNQSGSIGSINPGEFSINGIDSATNSIKVLGDKTMYFFPETTFNVVNDVLSKEEYHVISATYNGVHTLVKVSEALLDKNGIALSNSSMVVGTIPSVLFIQPKYIYNDDKLEYIGTPSTIVVATNPLPNDILIVDYYWIGPYQISIKTNQYDSMSASITNEDVTTYPGALPVDIVTTNITDEMTFGWGDITEWFQYNIIEVPTLNTIVVSGNAVADIQSNMDIEIIGLIDNIGIYPVIGVLFNGKNTIVTLGSNLKSTNVGGFVEPIGTLPIRLILSDVLSLSVEESGSASLVDAGDFVGSLDYNFYDVGSYDETTETIFLNQN